MTKKEKARIRDESDHNVKTLRRLDVEEQLERTLPKGWSIKGKGLGWVQITVPDGYHISATPLSIRTIELIVVGAATGRKRI